MRIVHPSATSVRIDRQADEARVRRVTPGHARARIVSAQAVQAPPRRLHLEPGALLPTHMSVPGTLSCEVVDSLRAMGHAAVVSRFAPGGFIGRVHAVMRTDSGWVGVVDPRTSGGAGGY